MGGRARQAADGPCGPVGSYDAVQDEGARDRRRHLEGRGSLALSLLLASHASGARVSAKDELRRIAFWADALTEAEAARALKGIFERRFPAGTYICHRGDRFDYWTGVVSGLMKISAISETARP